MVAAPGAGAPFSPRAHPDPEGCGSLGIALHPPGGSDSAAALITDGLTLNERVTFNYIMLCVLLCRVLCRFIYFNSAICAVHWFR